MIAAVITINGPKEVRATPIDGCPDYLAIVDKWRDTDYAMCVIAPVPGTDVWMTIGSPHDLQQSWFPRGQVEKNIRDLLSRLPYLCSEYGISTTSKLSPVELALARHVGALTTEQVRSHQSLVQAERQQRESISAAKQQDELAELDRRAASQLASFKGHQAISADSFVDLLAWKGISLPPRTAGAIRQNLSSIQVLEDGQIAMMIRKGSKPLKSINRLCGQLFES